MKLDIQLRWLIRRDMAEVLDIELRSFAVAWSTDDLLNCLRQRNVIGMVAEHNCRVIAFVIYELHPNRLTILNFAVDPEFRRQGVGTQMIDRLVDKLSQVRRREIRFDVRESNLTAQQFFRSQMFRACAVSRAAYEDTGEDAYMFVYRMGDGAVEAVKNECREGSGK